MKHFYFVSIAAAAVEIKFTTKMQSRKLDLKFSHTHREHFTLFCQSAQGELTFYACVSQRRENEQVQNFAAEMREERKFKCRNINLAPTKERKVWL
jgi:hypothetical protein